MFQYLGMIGATTLANPFPNPNTPIELFQKGYATLATASSPDEAASRGMVAGAAILLSAASSSDTNTSLAFGTTLP